jgi:hypothetical protein
MSIFTQIWQKKMTKKKIYEKIFDFNWPIDANVTTKILLLRKWNKKKRKFLLNSQIF